MPAKLPAKKVLIGAHAAIRMDERGFSREEVLYALANYATRKPYGGGLLRVFSKGLKRPIIVGIKDCADTTVVMTVMEWEP